MRREVTRALGPRNEYMFVVEGWSKRAKAPTFLHIHGAFFLQEPGLKDTAMIAIGRACGHGLAGYSTMNRAIHSKRYWGAGLDTWITYSRVFGVPIHASPVGVWYSHARQRARLAKCGG